MEKSSLYQIIRDTLTHEESPKVFYGCYIHSDFKDFLEGCKCLYLNKEALDLFNYWHCENIKESGVNIITTMLSSKNYEDFVKKNRVFDFEEGEMFYNGTECFFRLIDIDTNSPVFLFNYGGMDFKIYEAV